MQVLDWADATSYEKPQVPLSPPGSDCFRNLAYFLPLDHFANKLVVSETHNNAVLCRGSPFAVCTIPGAWFAPELRSDYGQLSWAPVTCDSRHLGLSYLTVQERLWLG